MKSPSTRMRGRLAQAAEWRALGASWPAVADRLGCRPEVCCRWPNRYPELWRHFLASAREKVVQQAFTEGLQILLVQMRSPDEKLRRQAARIVEKYLGRQ